MKSSCFVRSAALLIAWCLVAHARESGGTIANPIVSSGQDPWVLQWNGEYYLSQSRGGSTVWVNRSPQLRTIGHDQWVKVWTPPAGTAYSRNIWAPELHHLSGKWYIYFAADDGINANHRMYVLEGAAQDPQQSFVFKGKISAPTDRWAIDGTVIEMPGNKLYFVWSGWEGFRDGQQNLYIAPMSDPCTISGDRVCISRPEYPWEKAKVIAVNEGPQALWNGDQLFIIYSANGSWTDDYCLGQLRWTGGDPLDPKSWEKSRTPVFFRTNDVFGPGHPSFVKSRDGTEDWIIYHSAQEQGSGWRRQINMQQFGWTEEGWPCFGFPVGRGIKIGAPAGD